MADSAKNVSNGQHSRIRPWLALGAWAAIAALVLLWWAAHYTSFVALLAEWQFEQFGRYYPTLTFALFAGIVTLPIAVAIWLWRDARRRRERETLSTAEYETLTNDRALAAARRGVAFFAWFAILGVLVALGIAVTIPTLPTGGGAVRAVDAGSRWAEQGHVRMIGRVDLGLVARFDEDLVVGRRLLFVAPVRPGRGTAPLRSPVRYFTVVVPVGGDRSFLPIQSGVLVRRGLPKEVVNLYRAAGLTVADESYLLMQDDAQVRWRPLVLAGEAAAVALFAFLFWALFRRHQRVLVREIAESRLTQR